MDGITRFDSNSCGHRRLAFLRYSSCRLIIFSLPYSLANLLYSQNILGIFPPKTFHTPSWSRKMELSRAKWAGNGVSECVFARCFCEKPLSHAKATVNTADQLFRHHKHEVKPPNRRNMWEIAVRNPRNGRNMWKFPIWNTGKM